MPMVKEKGKPAYMVSEKEYKAMQKKAEKPKAKEAEQVEPFRGEE